MGISNVNEQNPVWGAAFRNKPLFLMSIKESRAFFEGKLKKNMELKENHCPSAATIHTEVSIPPMRFMTKTRAVRFWIWGF